MTGPTGRRRAPGRRGGVEQLEPMAVPGVQHRDPLLAKSLPEGPVGRHDRGLLLDGRPEDGRVAAADRGERREALGQRPGRRRARGVPGHESVELAPDGRGHPHASLRSQARDLRLERKAGPDRKEQRVRVE